MEEELGIWSLEEELGIWNLEEELGAWKLEIGIPDLSARIVAPHFGIGFWNWKRPGFKCKDCGNALLDWNFGTLDWNLELEGPQQVRRTAARKGAKPARPRGERASKKPESAWQSD